MMMMTLNRRNPSMENLMSVLHERTCVCFCCRNVNQWTPLDFASAEGHVDVVKHLLSEDVPVNPMDKEKVCRNDESDHQLNTTIRRSDTE